MKSLSVKEYLSLKMPTEEAPVSDQSRILLALDALGYWMPISNPIRIHSRFSCSYAAQKSFACR